MLLPQSTACEVLRLPRADELTHRALTALEAHFRRALRRAEELFGDGGAPREVALVRVREADGPSGLQSPMKMDSPSSVLWRVQLRADMGEAIHVMESRAASALVDALLGSPHSRAAQSPDGAEGTLSAVDCAVLREWIGRLASRLLGPVLDPDAQRTARLEQTHDGTAASVAANGTPRPTVHALFQVRANGVSGSLVLSLPTPAALKLAAASAPHRGSREVLGQQLRAARVHVQARLITTTLSLADVRSLEPGDVLALDVAPGDSAELLVNGAEKLTGKAGFMDGRLAFQVSGRIDSA